MVLGTKNPIIWFLGARDKASISQSFTLPSSEFGVALRAWGSGLIGGWVHGTYRVYSVCRVYGNGRV